MKFIAVFVALGACLLAYSCNKTEVVNVDNDPLDTVDCWTCVQSVIDSTEDILSIKSSMVDTCKLDDARSEAYQRAHTTGYELITEKDSTFYRRHEVTCQRHN